MRQTEKYIPTGNEMISIPCIREADAAIESVTFLHMGYKGMIEVKGTETAPLFKPFIVVNGREEQLKNIKWEKLDYWLPCFTCLAGSIEIKGIILAPIGERGFTFRLTATNRESTQKHFELGLKGCWQDSMQSINESKPINAKKYIYKSNWNNNMIFDLRSDTNIFSFAPICERETYQAFQYIDSEQETLIFTLSSSGTLEPNEEYTVDFFWGFGYEEVSAATSAKEMMRKGFEYELETTRKWLSERVRLTGDIEMDRILNVNLFFNFFFASGITMDTEEFALVTSRSPRYYVSAAYWDRDSLLWSFPSILLVDAGYAKEMLDYVFTRQVRNIGIHSRFIDGTVLEPGFELDELCAPIIALDNYLKHTSDYEILKEAKYSNGIDRIIKLLEAKKHQEIELYETFLQPTDDLVVYPYLTYDNVLVWKALISLADMYNSTGRCELGKKLEGKASQVKKAVWDNCVMDHNGKRIFAWSLDLKGGWNIYDEPPGSLQLLPFYGFCSETDEVYLNTVDIIRRPEYPYSFSGCNIAEIGCEHAPHPWVLSVANSLLCGRKEHCRDILMKTEMDNGIACESIDENTGECTTGAAFATCAGFLAYSIYKAFGR